MIGYCTNVHAGADLEQTWNNLRRFAPAVKKLVSPNSFMGVGLWLSARTARQLRESRQKLEFAGWLRGQGFIPYTMNGFPYGDFHQQVVKHRVYEPTWMDASRLNYTRDLIAILDLYLLPGIGATISTLPVAWGEPELTPSQWEAAAANLRQCAMELHELLEDAGRPMSLCLEPEPGCVLDHGQDVVDFFENYLLRDGDEDVIRRHIQVCHDVCHAAVMFESQREVLQTYYDAGIGVGKMQISSAVALDAEGLSAEQYSEAMTQLWSFAEDRYLHQTSLRRSPQSPPELYCDLPSALVAASRDEVAQQQWRVHFHVPIYLEEFGGLRTTQAEIGECLEVQRELFPWAQLEVETYAWNVLPEDLRIENLSQGIARELNWLKGKLG